MDTGKNIRTLRILKFFVTVGGERHECQLHVDDERNLSAVAGLPHLQAWAASHEDALPAGAKPLTAPANLPAPKNEDRHKRNIRFFLDQQPCWFPGCEELRARYKEELAEKSAAGACKGCEKGALMRKYLELVEELSTLATVKP